MSKPCESGNANASDVTPQECFFEIEDDNGTKVLASPVAAKKTKSSSAHRDEVRGNLCYTAGVGVRTW
uniref:Uncharacterized protein n=1 Tax=Magallana gigas TaxID=29159 RepID=A0A8W8MKV0_MAGGI